MDDIGRTENGRQRPDQYKSLQAQWMMPRQMKEHHTASLIALLTERDNAIHERNQAIAEKKAAITERDMVIMQRDAAVAERNNAVMERDNAIAALELSRANRINAKSRHGCTASHGSKHVHHQDPLSHVQSSPPRPSDAPYDHAREMHIAEVYPISTSPGNTVKGKKSKQPRKENNAQADVKKPSKSLRKSKRADAEDLDNQASLVKRYNAWKGQGSSGRGDPKKVSVTKNEWKAQELGLNQVTFEESTMPVPVCSCTEKFRQCYKWGNGGWQSSCCTTKLSMYPLPVMPNKRHARMGGRKMSGTAFTKLLSRLAAEGHDLSMPVDLKDHWAKHGTNRYITIK